MPKARILAVDDQRYFRELIAGLLSQDGYEVQTAESGEQALRAIEREDYDVVVTDLVMPGIDGTELVHKVVEGRPDQDVVIVTGVVDVKSAVEAMKEGASDYILKPFDRDTLTSSLEKILQRRRLRQEHARLMEENLEYLAVMSLYERAFALFSTLTLEPLAERLIEGLCLETRAQGGVVWLAPELGEGRLELAGARGLIRMEAEPEELEVGSLGAEFEPLVTEGRSLSLPWSGGREVGSESAQARALYLPLRHSGSLLGIARLTDSLAGGEFGDSERAVAERFVGFGAMAVVNALRFRSLERRSFRDPATMAYAHSYLQDCVRHQIQKGARFGHPFSLLRIEARPLAELRRTRGEAAVASWEERLVRGIGEALRAADLLSSETDGCYAVLLPETDALRAAVIKLRIREQIERSGVLRELGSEANVELVIGAVTYPADGTQVDALDAALDARMDEERGSVVRALGLQDSTFDVTIHRLLEEAELGRPEVPDQLARFVLDEVARSPHARGMLFFSPGSLLLAALRHGVEQLAHTATRSEIVLIADRAQVREAGSGITWIEPRRAATDRPFLLYFGEGSAYALVTASEPKDEGLPLFHSSDRALVEHLSFRLREQLGMPLEGAPA